MLNKSKKTNKSINTKRGGFFQNLFGKSKTKKIDRRKKILYTDENGIEINNPLYRQKTKNKKQTNNK